MTWYSDILQLASQPADTIITLIGQYTDKDAQAEQPPITIKLIVDGLTSAIYVLYTHSPKSLVYEEPTSDQLVERYRNKIRLYRDKVLATDFNQLSTRFG